ncbi:MAG TPA: hypothetical protein VGM94_11810 [Galbitalea sp.]
MSDDEPEDPSDGPGAETKEDDARVSNAASILGTDAGIAPTLGADFAKGIAPFVLGADFVKGITPPILGADFAKEITQPLLDGGIAEAIGKSSGIATAIRGIVGVTPILPNVAIPEPLDYGIADQVHAFTPYIDPAPRRTADAAEQTAEYTRDLLNAMHKSVQLNENARQENAEFAAFTRRVSMLAIVVAFASLGLGVASLVVAIVAINHP